MEALGSSKLLASSVTSSYHTQIAVGVTARNHVIFMNPASGFITGSYNDISIAVGVCCISGQTVFVFGYCEMFIE
jgi:hypothetical protein